MTENTNNLNQEYINKNIYQKFNWGAFGFSIIWGIFHKQWITLIILPISFITYGGYINLLLSIFFGIKGNEWAWNSKKWESPEKFHASQRIWVILLIVFTMIGIISSILSLVLK